MASHSNSCTTGGGGGEPALPSPEARLLAVRRLEKPFKLFTLVVNVEGRFDTPNYYTAPLYRAGNQWFIHNVTPYKFNLQQLIQAVKQMVCDDRYEARYIWFKARGAQWPGCLTCISGNGDMNRMWDHFTADPDTCVACIYIQDVKIEGIIRDSRVDMVYSLPRSIAAPPRWDYRGYYRDAMELQRLDDELDDEEQFMMVVDGEKWFISFNSNPMHSG